MIALKYDLIILVVSSTLKEAIPATSVRLSDSTEGSMGVCLTIPTRPVNLKSGMKEIAF